MDGEPAGAAWRKQPAPDPKIFGQMDMKGIDE